MTNQRNQAHQQLYAPSLPRQLHDSCNENQTWTGKACPICGYELKRVKVTRFEFCPRIDQSSTEPCGHEEQP